MTKALRVPDYVGHIGEAVARALQYIDGLDWEAFQANTMVQDATVRNIEIVGEAARNIQRADPGFARRFPDFPLVEAIGMRNALAHGYFGVRLDVVWKTVRDDFPRLEGKVHELLERLRSGTA